MGNPPAKGYLTLKTRSEFERVFNRPFRLFRDGLGFYARKSEHDCFRFGLVVSKKYGIAVERNKVRRRIKEVIRLSPELPKRRDVVICIQRPCIDFGFTKLRESFCWALSRLDRLSD